jgi:hypothetical protein
LWVAIFDVVIYNVFISIPIGRQCGMADAMDRDLFALLQAEMM